MWSTFKGKNLLFGTHCTIFAEWDYQMNTTTSFVTGGGRVVRRCWVNFQCQGVLLTWLTVGQGPIVLSVGAGGGCLDIFFSHLSFPLSPSLWETARYRLKYCLKGPLNPNQPTILCNLPTKQNSSPIRINRIVVLKNICRQRMPCFSPNRAILGLAILDNKDSKHSALQMLFSSCSL